MRFVKELYEKNGVKYYFFDEVHKYRNWSQELKNIYDSYPNIKIIFSGSSSLDLVKGNYDLSRRGKIYKLRGLSFREYLYFKADLYFEPVMFEDIIKNTNKYCDKIAHTERLKGHFQEYIEYGYYPFVFEGIDSYHEKILNIIDKTVYQDISNFNKLKTENLIYFKKIISFLATIPPGELNRNSVSNILGIDNKTVQIYLNILSETGLVHLLTQNKSGGNLLKSKEKLYLDNPNLYKAISDEIGFENKQGTLREIFFIKMLENSGKKVFYSMIGDFVADGYNFEVGGKNKTKKQIKSDLENSFLVKDDILYGSKHEIPLYLFGFLY
ncbi:MAG: AAA family ATPase [Candidatus Delongbacteria bacterium]|nr:AAA family ATPase [Candidatus Delongbacteria bacterium]